MRGRKPTPTMLFELHGKPNKGRKANPAEPKAVTGTLWEPPDWMSETQQLGWMYAIEHSPPGLLARIDRGVLAAWVVAEDLHRRATVAQNRAGGLVIKAPITGVPLQSPYLPIINKQAQIMIRAAGELGFSPVSRPRIGGANNPGVSTPTPDEDDHARRAAKPDLETFLAGRPTQH